MNNYEEILKNLCRKSEQKINKKLDKLEPDLMITLTNDQKQTLLKLVVKFQEAQIVKCVEEMSELTKELCKFVNNKNVDKTISEKNMDNISEEIADVYIMLEQMLIYFGNKEDVEKIINEKIERTKKRLLEEK